MGSKGIATKQNWLLVILMSAVLAHIIFWNERNGTRNCSPNLLDELFKNSAWIDIFGNWEVNNGNTSVFGYASGSDRLSKHSSARWNTIGVVIHNERIDEWWITEIWRHLAKHRKMVLSCELNSVNICVFCFTQKEIETLQASIIWRSLKVEKSRK